MNKILNGLKTDINFIRSHTLQPQWYKVLKIFILIGFILFYYSLFGLTRTIIFLALFFFMAALVHIIYRVKTRTWTQNWLDFIIIDEDGKSSPRRIGRYYYTAIIINAIISLVISQILI